MSDKYLKSEEQHLIQSIGTELCWGWSPAINLLEVVSPACLARAIAPTVASPAAAPANPSAVQPPTNTVNPTVHDADDLDALLADFDARNVGLSDRGSGGSAAGGSTAAANGDVHLFLCGACDIRHIFRTLAGLKGMQKRHAPPPDGCASAAMPTMHFHIYEPNLRVHARHVFFLQWLCDSIFSFDHLEEQVAMFLEVFGNSMLRDITAVQAKDVAQRALRTLGKQEGDLASMLSFDGMKAKERDFVEDQIRHWTRDASVAHIETMWNKRLRTDMAERYDNKDNIIDWDFNFHLHEYTNAIKFPEYRTWRNSGVAFDYCHINPRKGFQYEYTAPNKTLCHFDRKGNGLYVGDIKNGPFYAVGVDTRNTALHPRNADGSMKYGNGVTSMHNVRAWLYELMCGEEWPWADHAFAWDDAANYNYLPPGTPSNVEYHAALPKAAFHFLGLDWERAVQQRASGVKPKFDLAFVGSTSTQFMTPAFFAAMADDAPVICETAKFIVDCKDDTKDRFEEKIIEFGAASGWQEDVAATAFLHKDQPPPNKIETTLSDAQKKSAARLASKFVVVLKPHQKNASKTK